MAHPRIPRIGRTPPGTGGQEITLNLNHSESNPPVHLSRLYLWAVTQLPVGAECSLMSNLPTKKQDRNDDLYSSMLKLLEKYNIGLCMPLYIHWRSNLNTVHIQCAEHPDKGQQISHLKLMFSGRAIDNYYITFLCFLLPRMLHKSVYALKCTSKFGTIYIN